MMAQSLEQESLRYPLFPLPHHVFRWENGNNYIRSNGINIPAPIACKTRPPIIIGKLVEIPQTNEPIVNNTSAIKIAYDMNIY